VRSSRPPQVPLAPGRDADIGPYKLANRIAVGGMAEVFRALEEPPVGAPRSVVIKRMLPDLARDPECRRMFELEGELGMRIQHPNVVRVLDRGVDDEPYIVLEHVFGVDLWVLARRLQREGEVLRTPLAMYLVCEMLAGLAAVHDARDPGGNRLELEHRDVSPSNIFLSVHGDVKLGDLGIAVAGMRESHPNAPRNERGRGKLGYLAPETVRGLHTDQRADVFSAGVVAAELLLGRPLFTGVGEIGILLAIRDADVGIFLDAVDRLPPALGYSIMGALAREPDQRVQSAEDLRDALLPFVDEPVRKLRAELGKLVSGAVTDSGREQPGDSKAMAETTEQRISRPDSAGVLVFLDDDGQLYTESDVGDLVPAQAQEFDGDRYQVTRPGGEAVGEYRLAELVQAIATRKVAATDHVTTGTDRPAPILQFPHLLRHFPPSSRTPTLQRRIAAMNTTESYDLRRGGMLATLAHLMRIEANGLLIVEQSTTRFEVYVAKGAPQHVSSNRERDLLGARLVAQKVITQGELEMALAVMPRFDGRLGETLSTLGIVEPVQIVRHINAQVEERLMETFTWSHGMASFYGAVDPPDGLVPVALDPWAVLERAAALRLELGLEDALFLGRDGSSLLVATTLTPQVLERQPPVEVTQLLVGLEVPTPLARFDELFDPRRDPIRGRAKVDRGRRWATVLLAMGAIHWA
tara:strand:- start:5058 stop:7142 length:2085 start_codon:yes stop_codon:yes gene_type:complete